MQHEGLTNKTIGQQREDVKKMAGSVQMGEEREGVGRNAVQKTSNQI